MDDRSVVESYLRLAGDPDLDAYMALWADDGLLEMPYHPDPAARVVEGAGAIRRRAAYAREVFEYIRNSDVTVRPLAEPGAFVCEYAGEGRTRDGREYRNRYCCVANVRDGRMARWREYFDPTEILGPPKAPAPAPAPASSGPLRGTVTAPELRLACLEPGELDEEQWQLLGKSDWKARDEPIDDPWYRVIIRHPLLFRKWIGFGSVVLQKGDIPRRERQLLIVRTAWRCQCPAIFGYHVQIAHDGLPTEEPIGVTSEEIEQVVAGADHPAWAPFDAAVVRAVDELLDTYTISTETWDLLASRFTERQLVELPFLVGHYQMLCYSQNSLGIGPGEGGGLEAR